MSSPVKVVVAEDAAGRSTVEASPPSTPWRLLLPTPGFVGSRAPIVVPLVILTALSLATLVATIPLVRVAYASRPELLATATTGLWILTVLAPVAALLKAVVLGGVAWSVLVLTGAAMRHRPLMSAVLYGQVILVLGGAWTTALLWIMGTGRLHQPSDLVIPTGLDGFVADPSSPLGVLARGITPFHVVWFLFLAAVMARSARGGWWRGSLATFVVWTLVTGLGVIRALFT